MMHQREANTKFSLAETRALVADLFVPNPWIYWTDFLLTFSIGVVLNISVPWWPRWLGGATWQTFAIQCVTFIVSSLLYYRAALFIHELIHLPQRGFKALRFTWNLLCGFPFLIPTFIYYTHLDHHNRRHFGTPDDGEYLEFEHNGSWQALLMVAVSPLVPLVAIFRFGILTPLAWLHPALRRWVHRHASSMVIDPSYVRPMPNPATMRIIVLQEVGCFLAIVAGIVILCRQTPQDAMLMLINLELTATFIITLNAIRTLAAHRWSNDGREMTYTEQLLDSVSVDGNPVLGELWGPLGLRFHSLHHLFPGLPYHNLAKAHRRLMEKLPADSPYRQTVEPSLRAALWSLFTRMNRQEESFARTESAAG